MIDEGADRIPHIDGTGHARLIVGNAAFDNISMSKLVVNQKDRVMRSFGYFFVKSTRYANLHSQHLYALRRFTGSVLRVLVFR